MSWFKRPREERNWRWKVYPGPPLEDLCVCVCVKASKTNKQKQKQNRKGNGAEDVYDIRDSSGNVAKTSNRMGEASVAGERERKTVRVMAFIW